MGFLKSVVRVVSAPVTVPLKVVSNGVSSISNAAGLNSVPILGNVINSASSILATPDDLARGKDISSNIQETIKAGATTGSVILLGPTGGAVVGAKLYGGDALNNAIGGAFGGKNGGILEAVGAGLGIPPGTLSQFLPSDSPTRYYNETGGGGGAIPIAPQVDYGTGQKTNLFPLLAVGGGAIAIFLLMRRRK